jgi:uncharacterized membrane protein
MHQTTPQSRICAICGETKRKAELVPAAVVRSAIAELIEAQCPTWSSESYICRPDLAGFRNHYVQTLLEAEKGELTALETAVIHSLHEHETLSSNVDTAFTQQRSVGEQWADKIAAFGGSWKFISVFGAFLLVWMLLNSLPLLWRPADPFPFILLNLILSCLAAIQAPIIMMSQNRQEAKDRLRSEHDYRVNLKVELEIRHLHEKVDHLLLHQWERLVEIQQVQIELLNEITRRTRRPHDT